MTPGLEVLGLDVERSVGFVESLGWVMVGFVSEAGVSIWGVGLMVSGAVRRAMWGAETSELLSSLSSSDSRVLIVSFRLLELCKDSPATLLSVASVSVGNVPSSSLLIASRYSLRFRVGILEGAPSFKCRYRSRLWWKNFKNEAGFRVQRPSPSSRVDAALPQHCSLITNCA